MKKILLTALFTLVFVFAHSHSFALLSIEGRYWFTELDGDVKVTEAGVVGTDIDFSDDLGVDDEDFWEVRITLEFGKHKLRYGFIKLEWDGEKTITEEINFGGETFTVSTFVDSELNVDYHRLGYQYDFIDTLENRLGLILELKYFDIDARLKAPPIDESESLQVPVPTVGVAFQLSLPLLVTFGGEVTGVTLGGYGHLIDGEAALRFNPIPFLRLSGGYRYLKVKVEDGDDSEVDFDLHGPFLTLGASF